MLPLFEADWVTASMFPWDKRGMADKTGNEAKNWPSAGYTWHSSASKTAAGKQRRRQAAF